MEVLDGRWLRLYEYIEVDEDCVLVAITFGGRAPHTGIESRCTRSMSSGLGMGKWGALSGLPSTRAGSRSRGVAGVGVAGGRFTGWLRWDRRGPSGPQTRFKHRLRLEARPSGGRKSKGLRERLRGSAGLP